MRSGQLAIFVGASATCFWVVFGIGCVPPGKETIAPQYSRYSGCPEEKIVIDNNEGRGGYRASGCGNSVTFWCAVEGACRSPLLVVAQRHAKQFSCTPQEALVEDLGDDVYLAKGCGQKISYQCFPDRLHLVRCIAETTEQRAER